MSSCHVITADGPGKTLMSRLVTVSRVKVRRREAAQVNTRRPPSALYRDEWASTEARYSLHRQQLAAY